MVEVGNRVVLVHCDDPDTPPPGTEGDVTFIDDYGTVFVTWENGSRLGMVPDAGDRVERIERMHDAAG